MLNFYDSFVNEVLTSVNYQRADACKVPKDHPSEISEQHWVFEMLRQRIGKMLTFYDISVMRRFFFI